MTKRPPLLAELPPPPPGRTGWPWTEASPRPAPDPPEGASWPRIAVVTPSYNQGAYLEETIRSVLLQGYPNLEFIVVDGGSTDGTLAVIRRYEPWLASWVSEPDAGQTDAIRKGVGRSSGEILAWLNSDDLYAPGALAAVGARFARAPQVDLLYGDCAMIDEAGRPLDRFRVRQGGLPELLEENFIPQPGAFCRREVWEAVGGPDRALQFVMDYELWIRLFLAGARAEYLPVSLALFRYHRDSKSVVQSVRFGYEFLGVLDRIAGDLSGDRLRKARLQSYYRTFRLILAWREIAAADGNGSRDAVPEDLACWAAHLRGNQSEYRRFPRLLGLSYYCIGKYHCLHGAMEEGRRFLGEALRIPGGLLSRALPGRLAASLGRGPFAWYHRSCTAIAGRLQRGRS
jgi:glycosyltransferase involved in cell wall biosynthesis